LAAEEGKEEGKEAESKPDEKKKDDEKKEEAKEGEKKEEGKEGEKKVEGKEGEAPKKDQKRMPNTPRKMITSETDPAAADYRKILDTL